MKIHGLYYMQLKTLDVANHFQKMADEQRKVADGEKLIYFAWIGDISNTTTVLNY